MHISEGVLSPAVLTCGAGIALIGVAIGLKKMRLDQISLTGAMSAVFFVASLIHVPVGVANAHLILCGLCGVILGWASFPAIFTALLLQAVLFQYGGLTTIGVNTASMGLGAVCAWYIFGFLYRISPGHLKIAGFIGGAAGVAISAILTAASLAFTNESFMTAALALLAAHLPVMITEGIVTAFTVAFLAHTKPDLLNINMLQRNPA